MANHTLGEKFRAMLATGRVANLPTVWSNVIMAFCLATHLYPSSALVYEHESYSHQAFNLWLIFFACISTSFLYVGGCMLGDYRDIQFDRENRPNRPLVTGLLSPSIVAITAMGFLATGLIVGGAGFTTTAIICSDLSLSEILPEFLTLGKTGMMTLLQVTQLALLGLLLFFILTYALFHKRSRLIALCNMALCRTQLIIFAAVCAMPIDYYYTGSHGSHTYGFTSTIEHFHFQWVCYPILITAFSVGAYTLLLASVAATESNTNKIKFSSALKIGMLLLPLTAILVANSSQVSASLNSVLYKSYGKLQTFRYDIFSASHSPAYFIGAAIIYCGWMIYAFKALPNNKPAFVSRALAGFCLLDACFAVTYSLTIPLICLGLFGLSLLLQKITPAT